MQYVTLKLVYTCIIKVRYLEFLPMPIFVIHEHLPFLCHIRSLEIVMAEKLWLFLKTKFYYVLSVPIGCNTMLVLMSTFIIKYKDLCSSQEANYLLFKPEIFNLSLCCLSHLQGKK